jgi:hypothetical protein
MWDVDGWSISGNPDNTYNLLQPVKRALSHQNDQAYLYKFRVIASSASKNCFIFSYLSKNSVAKFFALVEIVSTVIGTGRLRVIALFTKKNKAFVIGSLVLVQ